MPINLENLRINTNDCEITVDVDDELQDNVPAKLKFTYEYQGKIVVKKKAVTLYKQKHSETIPSTPKDGMNHNVTATLSSDTEKLERNKILRFCNP